MQDTEGGLVKHIHSIAQPLMNEAGNVMKMFGTILDITERKRTEEELEKIFNLSPDMICVCTPEGKFIKVSPSCEKILGYTVDEIFKLGWAKLVHPDDAKRTNREVERQLKGDLVANFTNRFRCKDGTYKTLEWQATPLIGGIVYATARDITERKKAEKALRESEEKYRMLVEQAKDGVVIAQDGAIKFVNKAMSDISGYLLEELAGMSLSDITPPENRELAGHMQEAPIAGEDLPSCYYDSKILCKDGSMKHIELSISVIQYGGKPAVMGFLRDVTERRKAEGALRKSEEQFRAVFNSAANTVCIIDQKGTIIEANPQMSKMYGYSHKELVGSNVRRLVHPDYAHLLRKFMKDLPRSKEFYAESKDIHKNGTHIDVEIRGGRIDIEGESYLLAIIVDITERKKIEKAIAESEERYRNYLNSAPDGIFVIDASGKYIDVNRAACRITGYSSEELLNMTISGLFAPASREAGLNDFKEIQCKGTISKELLLRRKDGTEFYVALDGVKLSDDRYMVYCKDITDRKKAEERARQADKLASVGEMAAGLAHEINNPVTIIKGNAQYLQKKISRLASSGRARKEETEEYSEILKRIVEEGERCGKVTSGLLQFTRKTEHEVSLLDINEGLATALSIIGHNLSLDMIKVRQRFFPELPKISGNSDQLRQVFMNVILNARNAMPKGGSLTIKSLYDELNGNIEIRFTDTGRGIRKTHINRVFDPFFTTRKPGKGTGLGLSISHGIIKAHKGTIEVKSKIGKGSTFIIKLPAAKKRHIEK